MRREHPGAQIRRLKKVLRLSPPISICTEVHRVIISRDAVSVTASVFPECDRQINSGRSPGREPTTLTVEYTMGKAVIEAAPHQPSLR